MDKEVLLKLVRCGETSRVQFKERFTTQRQMAEEMVAFANGEGGDILFGIRDKTGEVVGLDYDEVQTITSELGNTANEHVRPTIYIRTDVLELDGKLVLVATVQRGRNKPYKDLSGTIWVKQGADKRRVTDNGEILSLFQESGEYHPDEMGVAGTSVRDLDTLALDRFFENVYRKSMSDFDLPQDRLLRSLHVTDEEGKLTNAGLLFFGQRPQQFRPTFVIKAVWFYGNSIAGTEYRDSRDIEGTIPEMYEQGMMWLKSCLRRVQDGQSFNSVGKLEISETVLEELLQNALVHCDLLKTAAICLLVFDDRVEIINPGCVAGGHSIEEIMLGNSFARNPLMANFCAKMMPYRGLGSGIPRVLAEDYKVEFYDDKAGNQFTASVSRVTANKTANKAVSTANKQEVTANKAVSTTNKAVSTANKQEVTANKTTNKQEVTTNKDDLTQLQLRLLLYLKDNPSATRSDMETSIAGATVANIRYALDKLRELGLLKRIGSKKYGTWEVCDKEYTVKEN